MFLGLASKPIDVETLSIVWYSGQVERQAFKEEAIYRGYRISKRWWVQNDLAIEWHVVVLEKRGERYQPIIRHDNDVEGEHLHLKILDVPTGSPASAETLVKNVLIRLGQVRSLALGGLEQ